MRYPRYKDHEAYYSVFFNKTRSLHEFYRTSKVGNTALVQAAGKACVGIFIQRRTPRIAMHPIRS